MIYIPLNSQELCSGLFTSCDQGGNACKLAASTVKLARLSGAILAMGRGPPLGLYKIKIFDKKLVILCLQTNLPR